MCFFLAVSYEHVLLSKNNNNDRKAIGGLSIKRGPGAPQAELGGGFRAGIASPPPPEPQPS